MDSILNQPTESHAAEEKVGSQKLASSDVSSELEVVTENKLELGGNNDVNLSSCAESSAPLEKDDQVGTKDPKETNAEVENMVGSEEREEPVEQECLNSKLEGEQECKTGRNSEPEIETENVMDGGEERAKGSGKEVNSEDSGFEATESQEMHRDVDQGEGTGEKKKADVGSMESASSDGNSEEERRPGKGIECPDQDELATKESASIEGRFEVEMGPEKGIERLDNNETKESATFDGRSEEERRPGKGIECPDQDELATKESASIEGRFEEEMGPEKGIERLDKDETKESATFDGRSEEERIPGKGIERLDQNEHDGMDLPNSASKDTARDQELETKDLTSNDKESIELHSASRIAAPKNNEDLGTNNSGCNDENPVEERVLEKDVKLPNSASGNDSDPIVAIKRQKSVSEKNADSDNDKELQIEDSLGCDTEERSIDMEKELRNKGCVKMDSVQESEKPTFMTRIDGSRQRLIKSLDALESQVASFQSEIAYITRCWSRYNKRAKREKQDRIDELKSKLLSNRFHIRRLQWTLSQPEVTNGVAASRDGTPPPKFTCSPKKFASPNKDLLLMETEEELEFRKESMTTLNPRSQLKCTKCGKILSIKTKNSNLQWHPLLKVLFCKPCKDYYCDGEFSHDEEGDDKYCRWCGQWDNLLFCARCHCAFCSECIKRNLGTVFKNLVEEDDEWQCFVCNPWPLWELRHIAALAMERVNAKAAATEDAETNSVASHCDSITDKSEHSEKSAKPGFLRTRGGRKKDQLEIVSDISEDENLELSASTSPDEDSDKEVDEVRGDRKRKLRSSIRVNEKKRLVSEGSENSDDNKFGKRRLRKLKKKNYFTKCYDEDQSDSSIDGQDRKGSKWRKGGGKKLRTLKKREKEDNDGSDSNSIDMASVNQSSEDNGSDSVDERANKRNQREEKKKKKQDVTESDYEVMKQISDWDKSDNRSDSDNGSKERNRSEDRSGNRSDTDNDRRERKKRNIIEDRSDERSDTDNDRRERKRRNISEDRSGNRSDTDDDKRERKRRNRSKDRSDKKSDTGSESKERNRRNISEDRSGNRSDTDSESKEKNRRNISEDGSENRSDTDNESKERNRSEDKRRHRRNISEDGRGNRTATDSNRSGNRTDIESNGSDEDRDSREICEDLSNRTDSDSDYDPSKKGRYSKSKKRKLKNSEQSDSDNGADTESGSHDRKKIKIDRSDDDVSDKTTTNNKNESYGKRKIDGSTKKGKVIDEIVLDGPNEYLRPSLMLAVQTSELISELCVKKLEKLGASGDCAKAEVLERVQTYLNVLTANINILQEMVKQVPSDEQCSN